MGDVIAIADDYKIVDIGIVKKSPSMLKQFSLVLDNKEKEIFDYDEEKEDTEAVEVAIYHCHKHIINKMRS